MSVWLRLNKREAVRKRGILCLSIIVCSLCLTHKKLPLLLFHIFVQAIPLPISFLHFLLARLMAHAPLNSCSEKHLDHLTSPFVLLFSPGHSRHHKIIYCPTKLQHKKTLPENQWLLKNATHLLTARALGVQLRAFKIQLIKKWYATGWKSYQQFAAQKL